MGYDLTLFSTIASASASFVAIIGGFIASKLIAINADRSAVDDRIVETEELFHLKMEQAEELKMELADDDALDFIEDHMDALAEGKPLSEVYETNKTQRLEYEDMIPYWNRAIELHKRFSDSYTEDCEVNEDGIPTEFATQIVDDSFGYAFCCKLADYEDGTKWMIQHSMPVSTKLHDANVSWYNGKQKEFEAILRDLGVVQLQREQLERQRKALVKPAHIKAGLWIFGLITLFDILLPLVFMRLIPIYPQIEECAETISVACMAAGLIATFIYLFCLLGWKPQKYGE